VVGEHTALDRLAGDCTPFEGGTRRRSRAP